MGDEEDGKNNNADKGTPEGDKKPEAGDAGNDVNNSNDNSEGESALDRAEANLKERKEVLEREEKLVARKEKLAAIDMVGGKAQGGQSSEPEKDPKEKAKEYGKSIMAGKLPEKQNE